MRDPSPHEYLLARVVETGELVGVIGRVAFSYHKDLGLSSILPLSLATRACSLIGSDFFPGIWLESKHDRNSGVGFILDEQEGDSAADLLELEGYTVSVEEFSSAFLALLQNMWPAVLKTQYQPHQIIDEEDAPEKRQEMHDIIARLREVTSLWVVARIRADHQLNEK